MEEWKRKCKQQEMIYEKLREYLTRTEQEVLGMLHKKYEQIRGPNSQGFNPKTQYQGIFRPGKNQREPIFQLHENQPPNIVQLFLRSLKRGCLKSSE